MKIKKKKLLLVEDDIIDQKAFKRFADQAEFPFDYDIADSVKEAKKSLKSEKYDVILSDYSLGDGTAFDVLKIVTNIPMVIVTGAGDEEIAVKALKLGAYDYLIKDIAGHYHKMVPVILENAIKRFLTEQSLHEYHENLEKLVDERTAKLKKEIIERKQAEEALRKSKEQFRNLVENTSDWVWEMDKDGVYTYVNPNVSKLIGYTVDEVLGKTPFDFMPEGGAERIAASFEGFVEFQAPIRNLENINVHKDGHLVYLETSGVPFFSPTGELLGYRGIDRDITERKQAEEELIKHRDHLEDLVEERNAELVASNKELEAFSYSVSHDLRAPLRAIDGFTGILLEEYVSKLDKEGKRLGSIIQDNAKKMGNLIDDLLSFSRMGRAAMHLSKIDMKNMVNAIYQEATNAIERKRITFTIARLPKAEGDTNMMREVWINLISNALKFSSYRKQAVISVSCQEEQNKLIYSIKDNGVGFDIKYVDKVFRVFQRLHTSKEFEGTGVGLAIVRILIHKHGGEVMAEGKVNKGATFYFSLPKNNSL